VLEPWVRLEQSPLALPVRLALPPAPLEMQARSVSLLPGLHSLVEAPRALQVSTVQPSQLLPWLLFPLWQLLPLGLPLRRHPKSFCAPSPQRPQESSSSASSFP